MPNSKDYLEGIFNLRGEPVFIINFRKYYSIGDYPNLNEIKILILNSKGQKFGIMVDEIVEILKTDKVNVSRSPSLTSRNILSSIKNHINDVLMVKRNTNKYNDSEMVIVLNPEKIISAIELNLEEEQIISENELNEEQDEETEDQKLEKFNSENLSTEEIDEDNFFSEFEDKTDDKNQEEEEEIEEKDDDNEKDKEENSINLVNKLENSNSEVN